MSRSKAGGQGIVEYAGAMVVAAAIVSIALITLPPGAYTLITDIYQSISTFIINHIQALG